MIDYLKSKGFDVESNNDLKRDENGLVFSTAKDWKKYLIKTLKKGYPIIIENVEAGGHYRVIFGYDELSKFTKNENNDMLIFSDPADNYDCNNEGYNFAPAVRTFKMWFDDHHLPKSQKKQPFITIKGLKK